jgi:hypothetical protein
LYDEELQNLYSVIYRDQIKEEEMGKICSMHGADEMNKKFWYQDSKGRDHLGDVGIDGRIILK